MKKLLALVLVLGMASVATAGVLDVVGATSANPGDIIPITIKLNHNAVWEGEHWATYDGYVLSSLNVALKISGPGTLGVQMNTKGTLPTLGVNSKLSPFDSSYAIGSVADFTGGKLGLISGNINQLTGVALESIVGVPGGTNIIWNLFVVANGPGVINVDLAVFGQSDYAEYLLNASLEPGAFMPMTEQHFGDLAINVVPEPMTMSLLAIGGMALLRRRRA